MRNPRFPLHPSIRDLSSQDDNPKYVKPKLPYNFDQLPAKERYQLAYRLYRAGNTEINALYDCYIKGVIKADAIDKPVHDAIRSAERRTHNDMRINRAHQLLSDPMYRKDHTIDKWLIQFHMGLPTYSYGNWFLQRGH